MLGAAASLQGGPSVLHLRGASWPGYGISFQVEGCPDILAALWKLRGCPVSLCGAGCGIFEVLEAGRQGEEGQEGL